MANKYCNLDGTKRIQDEFSKITTGFTSVESDVNLINNRVDTILNETDLDPNKDPEVTDSRISTVKGLTYTVLKDRLEAIEQYAVDKATKTDIVVVGKPRIVGHRGLSGIAPENTIPSYVMAGKVGVWAAEADIQKTSDGVWVLMHDLNVDRMTNGTANVKDLTLAQIKALNIDSGVNIGLYPNLKVPTLEEYLMVCKQYSLVPVVEVKSAFNANDCLELVVILRKYNFEEKSIILTADLLILLEIRKHSKKIHVQYLASISEVSINNVFNMENASINEEYSTLTKDKIEQAHLMGISVNTWTVNLYETARNLIGCGLDMLTTDVIAELKF